MNLIPSMPDQLHHAIPAVNPQAPFTVASTSIGEGAKNGSIFDSKIMIIDDEKFNTLVAKKYLVNAGFHNHVTCTDGRLAFDLIKSEKPDVILLDIVMPEVSGLDILRMRQKERELKYTPVIVLTASTGDEVKRAALDLGATDFLAKPVDPNDLVPRVRNTLLIKAHHDNLQNYADTLNHQVEERTAELLRSREEIIHCLGRAAEYRDNETGQHVIRVAHYCGVIADELGFDNDYVEMIRLAAQLHDIGKIGIPDDILLSPGKLSVSQFEHMKLHCKIGHDIICPGNSAEWIQHRRSERNAGISPSIDSPLMQLAASIARTHHEKWNGSGYPNGLAGENIPIEGRITAVADVFDALSSQRPYKPAFELQKCLAIIKADTGTHFDPKCASAFFNRLDDILHIKRNFADINAAQ
jgi:putative two-component system response regulator